MSRFPLAVVFVVALVVGVAWPAAAATINVTSATDVRANDGVCTLREAIIAANTNTASGAASGECVAGQAAPTIDTIQLPNLAGSPDLFTLTLAGAGEDAAATGDLDITASVEVRGQTMVESIVQAGTTPANGIDRVFDILPSAAGISVAFVNLAIRHGITTVIGGVPATAQGAGIYFRSVAGGAASVLSLSSVAVTANTSGGSGGGVAINGGFGTVNPTLAVTNSEIASNTAALGGAGIECSACNLTITSSAVLSNVATVANGVGYGGGGIRSTGDNATVSITNSTLGDNRSHGDGGALDIPIGAVTANLTFATVYLNRADDDANSVGIGGGVRNTTGTVVVHKSIVAGNLRAAVNASDCSGSTSSSGYNVVGSTGACPTGGTGDVTTAAATLTALDFHGGTTRNYAPMSGSPALERIPSASCGSTVDQRGFPRPRGPATPMCESGAVENSAPSVVANNAFIDEDAGPRGLPFTVTDAETPDAVAITTTTSSNDALIPDANLTASGSGANRTLTVTSLANQYGLTTIAITASDGSMSSTDDFQLTVNAVNDAPTISDIANQTAFGSPVTVPFTIGDVDNAATALTLSGTSSNQAVVPNANIGFSGSGANRSITVTPVAGQFGTTTITVTVSDGAATAQDTFDVTVTAPTITVADVSMTEGTGGTATVNVDVTLSQTTAVDVTVQYTTVQGTAIVGTDITGPSGTLTFPAGTTSQTIALTVTSDAAVEINETVKILLSAPTNAVLGDAEGVVTITDDDGTTEQTAGLVAWVQPVQVDTGTGSVAKRTDATQGWNAGASSAKALLEGNGTVEFTPAQVGQFIIVGLSRGDTNADYSDVDFGIELLPGGSFGVIEGGTWRGTFGTHTPSDRFAVRVANGVVTYRRNGGAFYTSAGTPQYPLGVDTAIYDLAAGVRDVVLAGRVMHSVTWTNRVQVTATGNNLTRPVAFGTGWNAGAASTRGLVAGDGYVQFTATEGTTTRMLGLSRANATASYAEIGYGLLLNNNGLWYVYEDGVWRNVSGAYATGDRFQIAIEGGVVVYRRNGILLYTSAVAPSYPLLVDTALYTAGATLAEVVLNGTLASDVTWIGASGVTVAGNTLTATAAGWGSAGAISTRALVRGSGWMEFTTSETTTSKLAGLSKGNASHNYADVDFGVLLSGNGTYYVFEGGTSRGVFGAYAAGDRFRVGVEGGVVRYRRNGVLFYTSAVAPSYPLLVDTSLFSPGATIADVVITGNLGEVVSWTSAVNVTTTAGMLTKVGGGTAWNAGAVSTQTIASGDGFVTFTTNEATTHKLLGLSVGNTNTDATDVDFAILLASNGTYYVFEAGTFRGMFGAYVAGDRFTVAVDGGAVVYQKNGATFYTSAAAPGYPLLVDTALFTPGATLSDVILGCVTAACQ